jgi:hypothetical protein
MPGTLCVVTKKFRVSPPSDSTISRNFRTILAGKPRNQVSSFRRKLATVKWLLIIVLFIVALLIVVVLIGSLLSRDHTASRANHYNQSPEAIWAAITDVDSMPSWREGLKSIQHLPSANGLPAHLEVTSMGTIPYQTTEMAPPSRLVRRISGSQLPFGGSWTFEIVPAGSGATLRITENGYVTNPFFRFVSRFVLGYTSEMDRFLRALAKKFNETPHIGD